MAEAKETLFDIRDIMGMLAHRFPFLLVDRVIAYEKGKSLTAIKNVTYNEPFFMGHFPAVPTMPGVLMVEALAQTCGLLTSRETGIRPESGVLFYFAGIDHARFKRIVVPGDQLQLYAEIDKIKRTLWKFKVRATVEDDLACEAELLCVFKYPPKNESAAKPGSAPSVG
ncbi:MAG: 3-hydroxyacyl-ACP dehydratase FabZ [Nevskiaceae bacterium]|nr:MAG: 3-hydroxyacyl-ACP dehydratase FabZ [Nevskiaceae bacterium]TBR72074.1 MAG: 3-hydroxyacyl-ACP dehydratase FabZ [Nevskiaceae bacterium]